MISLKSVALFFFLSALFMAPMCHAEVWTGTVIGREGFNFLGKFAYPPNPVNVEEGREVVGWIDVKLRSVDAKDHSSGSFSVYLMALSDYAEDYPLFYHTRLCSEKPILDGVTVSFDKDGAAEPVRLPINGGTRSRFRFLVMINCDGYGHIHHHSHFTRDASAWDRELGVNIDGLNTLYVTLLCLSFVLLIVSIFSGNKLTTSLGYVHPLIRFSCIIVSLLFLTSALHAAHFGTFSDNGEGAPLVEAIASLLDVVVRVLLIMLLILIASGWFISRRDLRSRNTVVGFCCAFALAQICSLAVSFFGTDYAAPSLPVYVVVTHYVVVSFGFIFALWLFATSIRSIKAETNPAKRRMLIGFAIFFSLYTLSLPLVSFLSIALDAWVRTRVVTIATASATFAALCFLTGLLWHTRARKYFELAEPSPLMADPLMADTDFSTNL